MAYLRSVLLMTLTWIFFLVVHYRKHSSGPSKISVKTARGYVKYTELEQDVFIVNNFKLLTASKPLPMLEFITKPTCEQIFVEWLGIASQSDQFGKPPDDVPMALRNQFTLNGYSLLDEIYEDSHAKQVPREWTQIPALLSVPLKDLESTLLYGKGSNLVVVYHALNDFPQRNKKGLVVGSQKLWVEVFALRNGAREVVTLEYQNTTIYGTNRVKYMHPVELARRWPSYKDNFDFVVSFSSIEHSGLGRYGDPLDPIGDLREVWKITCLLKPKGYFFVGVPTGQDAVVFNLHRIYGTLRLAMVMTGFEWVATYSGDDRMPIKLTQGDLEYYSGGRHVIQYLYVLRKIS